MEKRSTIPHFLSPLTMEQLFSEFAHFDEEDQTILAAGVDGLFHSAFGEVEDGFVPLDEMEDRKDRDRAFAIQTLMRHTNFDKISGKEIDEKAANFYHMVQTALEYRTLEEAAEPGEISQVLRNFISGVKAKEQMQQMSQELQDMLEDGEEGEEEREDGEDETPGNMGGKGLPGRGSSEETLANLDADTRDALAKMALIESYNLDVGKRRKFIEDPEGPYAVDAQTGSVIQELLRNPFATMDEQFAEKAMTSTFDSQKRYKMIEEKQSILLLIDDSGSMDGKFKRAMVKALMLHLMDKMLKGDLDLYIGLFEENVRELVHITKENCKKYFQDWTAGQGGMTQVGDVIEDMQKQIATGTVMGHVLNPETQIVIINDGEDPIGNPTLHAPVNAISLDKANDKLESLCSTSGGVFFHYQPTPEDRHNQWDWR